MYTYKYMIPASARHRPNGYLAQRVPSQSFSREQSLASSFGMCLNREVLKGMLSWMTRY